MSPIQTPFLGFRPTSWSLDYSGRVRPCAPCILPAGLFSFDCSVETAECPIYPWVDNPVIQNFGNVLGQVLGNYLISNGFVLNNCILNSLVTRWYVEILYDGNPIIKQLFYNGIGYGDEYISYPTIATWDSALDNALNSLKNLGYDYYKTDNDTVILYYTVCPESDSGINFKINVGIDFSINCQ